MTEDQIKYYIDAVKEFFQKRANSSFDLEYEVSGEYLTETVRRGVKRLFAIRSPREAFLFVSSVGWQVQKISQGAMKTTLNLGSYLFSMEGWKRCWYNIAPAKWW